jgi:hypothetical protein
MPREPLVLQDLSTKCIVGARLARETIYAGSRSQLEILNAKQLLVAQGLVSLELRELGRGFAWEERLCKLAHFGHRAAPTARSVRGSMKVVAILP